MTIIYAILMLCVLIFVHELGHFITAKACGVKVNEFALGMGPCIIQRQKGDTMYSLRAIPIGGYCAMEGEDEESDDVNAFNNKKAWQKIVILVAGSFMNLLVALILMTTVTFFIGTPSTTVGKITTNSPAEYAGIMPGDKIVQVDDTKIDEWNEFTKAVDKSEKDGEIYLVLERDGKPYEVTTDLMEQDGRMIVGITAKSEKDAGTALINGPKATWELGEQMIDVLKQLFTGDVAAKELSGPVGIVYMVDETVSAGFITFLYFMAMLSLNLAIVNMLPFPALDGGRVIFVIIRKITGKAITDKMEAAFHAAGLVLLMALMLYVTWNDIIRFIMPIFK